MLKFDYENYYSETNTCVESSFALDLWFALHQKLDVIS